VKYDAGVPILGGASSSLAIEFLFSSTQQYTHSDTVTKGTSQTMTSTCGITRTNTAANQAVYQYKIVATERTGMSFGDPFNQLQVMGCNFAVRTIPGLPKCLPGDCADEQCETCFSTQLAPSSSSKATTSVSVTSSSTSTIINGDFSSSGASVNELPGWVTTSAAGNYIARIIGYSGQSYAYMTLLQNAATVSIAQTLPALATVLSAKYTTATLSFTAYTSIGSVIDGCITPTIGFTDGSFEGFSMLFNLPVTSADNAASGIVTTLSANTNYNGWMLESGIVWLNYKNSVVANAVGANTGLFNIFEK